MSARYRGDLLPIPVTLGDLDGWARATEATISVRPWTRVEPEQRGWIVAIAHRGVTVAERDAQSMAYAVELAVGAWHALRRQEAARAATLGHSAECPLTHRDYCERCGWDAAERGAA